jgi:small GTP-binding protein
MDPDYKFKIVIIGEPDVGKSSLMRRFSVGTFTHLADETIGMDLNIKTLKVGEKIVKLELWDTSGSEKYASITQQYYRSADAIMVVFDVSDADSSYTVEDWVYRAEQLCNKKEVPFLVVGNKVDKKPVNPVEIYSFSRPYIITSAKTGENVVKAFETIAKKCIEAKSLSYAVPISPLVTISISEEPKQPESRCFQCF